MSTKKTYSEKLKDPRWQKKRLEVLQRDEWMCTRCGENESTLHVHHKVYLDKKNPWEYDLSYLATLCESCHEFEFSFQKEYVDAMIREFLKKGFLANDFFSIAEDMFYCERLPHIPEVTASALGWMFKTPEVFAGLIELYFEHLKQKQLKREEAQNG